MNDTEPVLKALIRSREWDDELLESVVRVIEDISDYCVRAQESSHSVAVIELLKLIIPVRSIKHDHVGTIGFRAQPNQSLISNYNVEGADVRNSEIFQALVPFRVSRPPRTALALVMEGANVDIDVDAALPTSAVIENLPADQGAAEAQPAPPHLSADTVTGPILGAAPQTRKHALLGDQIPDISLVALTFDAQRYKSLLRESKGGPNTELKKCQYTAPVAFLEDKSTSIQFKACNAFAKDVLYLLHAAPTYGNRYAMVLCGLLFSRVAYLGPGSVAIEVNSVFKTKTYEEEVPRMLTFRNFVKDVAYAFANTLRLDDTASGSSKADLTSLARFASIFDAELERFKHLSQLQPIQAAALLSRPAGLSNALQESISKISHEFRDLISDPDVLHNMAHDSLNDANVTPADRAKSASSKAGSAKDSKAGSGGRSSKGGGGSGKGGGNEGGNGGGGGGTGGGSTGGKDGGSDKDGKRGKRGKDAEGGGGGKRTCGAALRSSARTIGRGALSKLHDFSADIPALSKSVASLSDGSLPSANQASLNSDIEALTNEHLHESRIEQSFIDPVNNLQNWRKVLASSELASPGEARPENDSVPSYVSDGSFEGISVEELALLLGTRVLLCTPDQFDQLMICL